MTSTGIIYQTYNNCVVNRLVKESVMNVLKRVLILSLIVLLSGCLAMPIRGGYYQGNNGYGYGQGQNHCHFVDVGGFYNYRAGRYLPNMQWQCM